MKLLKLFILSRVIGLANAVGGNLTIGFSNSYGALKLSGGQIVVGSNDHWGVIKAANDLATDFGRITGRNLTLYGAGATTPAPSYTWHAPTSNYTYEVGPAQYIIGPTYTSKKLSNAVIIVGTIGQSTVIDTLINSKKIDVSETKGKWESYHSEVVKNPIDGVTSALVIAGSDYRGAIYGIYDISEQIGVSPWYFWADVPPKKQSDIYALNVKKIQGPPSVKYRGLFINDEQPAVTDWILNNRDLSKGIFNHWYYSLIYELLLRLKANYMWPAQWNSMQLVDDLLNQPLADAHAVVLGTSHTEPMQRATNEWNNFGGGKAWRWDTENATIYPFFVYGAERASPYINTTLFTMAMRGSGDTAIPLSTAGAVAAVEGAVAAQEQILGNVFKGGIAVKDIPKMWCLYKEVQYYYEGGGLDVPEDITLLWADDNWGSVRRLSVGNETSRAAGSGVYYHMDYVGDTKDYKWINTINMVKTVHQMKLAKSYGADRIWIVNVGDLKPLEIPINHYFDLAYNTDQWDYDSVPQWLELWATRDFGAMYAKDIASVMDRYGLYAARRKYELVAPWVYSAINYEEIETVLGEWVTLAADAQAIANKLPSESQAAFFEMVLHPVLAGGEVYQIHLKAAKNLLYSYQRRTSTNTAAQDVLTAFSIDAQLTKKYHTILGGKWNGMMMQTHLGYDTPWYWQQPMRNVIPPVAWVQASEVSLAGGLGIGVEGSNGTVPGDDAFHANSGNSLVLPNMDPYGPITRYIDLFSRGPESCTWTVISPPYLKASPAKGTVGGATGVDTRVYLQADWSKVPAGNTLVTLNFTSTCNFGNFAAPQIMVTLNNTAIPSGFTGFVESDKHISIEAEHYTKSTTAGGVSYRSIPGLSRTLSGVTLMPVTAASQTTDAGPMLSYDFYTFTDLSGAKKLNVTLWFSVTHNFLGFDRPLRYALAVDSDTPTVVQPISNYVGSGMPVGWGSAVCDSIWGQGSGNMTTTSHSVEPGKHTLKYWSLEPGLVLQKIVMDLGGVRYSYLGPPESFRAGIDKVGTYKGVHFDN